jgi:cell division ATP-binding protein FtsE
MIRLENVTKVYKGDVTALREVSAEIQSGEFVFLVGQSGSGKSTFLRLLNREEVPDSGKIWVAGKDLSKLRSWSVPHFRRSMGCVFQDYKLLHKKTVFENVAFALEVIGQSRPVIRKTFQQSWTWSGWRKRLIDSPTNSPAVSNKESPSLEHSLTAQKSCWPMNPPATLTLRPR